jgi:hypothetical protein
MEIAVIGQLGQGLAISGLRFAEPGQLLEHMR